MNVKTSRPPEALNHGECIGEWFPEGLFQDSELLFLFLINIIII